MILVMIICFLLLMNNSRPERVRRVDAREAHTVAPGAALAALGGDLAALGGGCSVRRPAAYRGLRSEGRSRIPEKRPRTEAGPGRWGLIRIPGSLPRIQLDPPLRLATYIITETALSSN